MSCVSNLILYILLWRSFLVILGPIQSWMQWHQVREMSGPKLK